MAFRPPSNIKKYSDHSPFDPAFVQLDDLIAKLGDAPDLVELEKVKTEHGERIARARETSDWSELRIAGTDEPTRFDFAVVDGEQARALLDLGQTIGTAELLALWFRAGIASVVGLGNDTLVAKPCQHPKLPRKIADPTIANLFDDFDIRIVAELGGTVMRRAVAPSPRR